MTLVPVLSLVLAAALGSSGPVGPAGARPAPERSPDELTELLSTLDAADPATFARALRELEAVGAPAAERALQGFASLAPEARRARARLVLEVASPASIDAVRSLVRDPDPEVRRLFARFLGELGLENAAAQERVELLRALAADDPSRGVRREALEALERAALPGTPRAVDRLLDSVESSERVGVASVLVGLPNARERVVARVIGAFEPEGEPLDGLVLVTLLNGYGRALAELPRGGAAARERVPFVLGYRHPAVGVRQAAWRSLRSCLSRLFELGEHARSDALLAALGDEGLPRHDLLYRRVKLALSGLGDAERALDLAVAMESAAELAPQAEVATFRVYAVHLQGAALFALGELERARERFREAARLLDRSLEERLDLGQVRVMRLGGAIMVDRLQMVSLEAIWVALSFLAEGVEPGDERVLERLRYAHEVLLRARVLDMSTDAESDSSTFDVVFDRDLAPGPLVMFHQKLERFSGTKSFDLMRALGRGLATVAPWEFPGFEAAPDPDGTRQRRVTDPLFDASRFELYVGFRAALYAALRRRIEEERNSSRRTGVLDEGRIQNFAIRMRQLEEMERGENEKLQEQGDTAALSSTQLMEIFQGLVGVSTTPSLFALTLATNLRVDGRSGAARELGSRILRVFDRGIPGASDAWREWASARVELMIGSSYMDDDRPAEAERVCSTAVRRLEELENKFVAGGADPETNSSIAQIRAFRSNAFLSMAVNANVRMNDTERALEFFERAYALDQSDDMRVLLACYRARSGKAGEAHAALRGVRPSPPLYYNLACTYALLGDEETALDFLLREMAENHPSPGSLERQKEWARGDPDLASLRDNEKFRRLVGLD